MKKNENKISRLLIISFLLLCNFSLFSQNVSIWDGTDTTIWQQGTGVQSDPFLIENATQFAYLATSVNNGNSYSGTYFRLTTHIDLNGYEWKVIGNSNSTPFQGNFNGDNFTIKGLKITLTGSSPLYVGLFGYLNSAAVRNLHIIGGGKINLTTNNTLTYYIGAIAGYLNASRIDSCSNSTSIVVDRTSTTTTTYNTYVGGIAGYATSNLSFINQTLSKGAIDYNFSLNNSSSSSNTWYHYVGGVVGYVTSGASVTDAGRVNALNITSDIRGYYKNSYVYSGGIAGYMNGSSSNPITIARSYNRGNVSLTLKTNHTYSSSNYAMSSYGYVGGIAGYSSAYNTITDCYNRGRVTPTLYAQSSYSSSYATSNAYSAGILGNMASTTSYTFTNSYNAASIPESCTMTGNGNKNYYHDVLFYNTTTFSATNCYHLQGCCTNNAHYSIPKTQAEMTAPQMLHSLNGGTPGSGIWGADILPYCNAGFPIFNAPRLYEQGITTLPPTDITATSAHLHAFADTNFLDLTSLTNFGFEYRLLGDASFTTFACTPTANVDVTLGQILPCTTYVYRAFAEMNGIYIYGDTFHFTTLCQPVVAMDTTICFGDSFSFHGQTYPQPGTFYQVVNGTTYVLNIHNYPSRDTTIMISILEGEDYYVNGVAYSYSGTYTLNFDTDIHGCDSNVVLILHIIPTQVSVWDGSAQPWVFGDGSQANPYIIENASQLAYMANVINANSLLYKNKYFELIADIDLGGYQWFGIGNSASNPFRGHFEGNNHTIDNLNIDIIGSTPVYIGLFGYLDSASVRNLHIIGNGVISLNNNNTATYYIGSVAAYLNHSSVIGCSNSTQFDINRTTTVSTVFNTYVGGIVGYATGNLSLVQGVLNKGEINYSFGLVYSNTSSYSWYHYVGGVVGYMNNGASLADAGHVNAINLLSDIRGYAKYSYLYGGGLVGYMTGSSANPITIARSYNRGNVSLALNTNHTYSSSSYPMYSYGYVGGIAGYSSAYNTITDCYNRGAITPVLNTRSSYSAGYATAYVYSAGILGNMASTTSYTFANCYNTANIPATCTTIGNGTNNYYSDAQFYNSSAFAATNCYHLGSCCANNAHFSISRTEAELRDLQMLHSLNGGTPGSGIWKRDQLPYCNNGFPIFNALLYEQGLTTLPPTDITATSANLHALADTNFLDFTSLTDFGFEYRLLGDTSFTTFSCTPTSNVNATLGQLLSCTTYVYRAFAESNGIYVYGDTFHFTTLCQSVVTIDTTICHGDLFSFHGQTYPQPGTFYQVVNGTTYVLNIHNYPSRDTTIMISILEGEDYYVNGVAYNHSGTYTLIFDTDIHGCDSNVVLILQVIPTQVSVWDGSAQPWVFGDGSQANPYIIENASQLAYMANVINSNSAFYDEKHFELIADIDLGGYQWFGIGNSASNPFRGHFEGNNHTIDNLNIDIVGSTPVYIGLFGYLDSASVRNLHIIGNGLISLNNNNTATYYIGSVAAYLNHSSVIGCSNSTQFDINRTTTVSTIFNTYVGGIVGYATGNLSLIQGVLNKGEINYSFGLVYSNTSSYSWYHYVGGVVGYMNNGVTLADAGHVNAINLLSDIRGYAKYSYLYGGGLVGYMTGSSANPITIARSYNRGNVSLALNTNHTYTSSSYPMYSYGYVGGIAGYSSAYNTITDCYNRGAITPVLNTRSSYSAGYSTAYVYSAGILGNMASTTSYTFANCYNTANIPATCTTIGNGTNNYYSDAQFYNSSAFAATNCYHLGSCCANNAHFSISRTEAELRDLQMLHSLNGGTPGSGIWKQDQLPYCNNGFPIFNALLYEQGLTTLPPTDITATSANLHALADTNFLDLSSLTDFGFEYRLLGDTSFTIFSCTPTPNVNATLGQLLSCTTYVYRAFAESNGIYVYGDTFHFTTLCQSVVTIDTTICHGDSFTFHGQTYPQPGTFYQVVNGTTYVLDIHNYPSRDTTIMVSILENENYYVNGVAYNHSGTYTLNFDTDIHGCDSNVTLILHVIPTQVSVWDGSAQSWVFGDGSQANPYIIENASQLAYMANVINSNSAFYDEKHFELIADIDLGGYQWFGIGNSASNPFRGHFEGNNHTIDNLNIDIVGSTPVYIGLFGYLDSASVRNLHIIGNGVISLNNNNTATYYIGSVAAYLNHSSVIGCSNSTQFDINRTTTVSTTFNTYVGGIVGYATGNLSLVQRVLNKGEINYSFGLVYSNTSSYSWYHYVGGVVGYMNNGVTLADAGHVNAINLLSDTRGYAKTSYLYGGGLVGYMTGSSANPITIARSYNRGNVSLTLNTNHTYSSSSYPMYSYGYVGGIAGYSSAYNTITDCYNRGALTPVLYAQSSYNANYSTNNTYIAGILGYMASTTSYTFANCYNTANIPATCTTSGNGTNNYYSDALFYNSSAFAATNSYHLNSCCANNAHFSISKTQTELRDLQMIHSLNVGTPGSGIWKQDRMPYQNSGYPLFVDGFYDIGIETKRATDVTAISAQLNGYIDTTVHDLSTISQVGFQYKLEGSASYITVPTTSDANPLLLLTQLTPCTTYTYRLYVYSGGNYLYGDTLNFQTLCQATDTINTITCYGDPFIIDGQTYTTPGTYYQVIQDTTFVINYNNYPSRMLILDTTLIYGNSLLINGVYYSQTGTYTIVFDTDLHGCDSTILLNLTVIPDLQSTVTSQNVSCHGGRTGVIIVTPSEGAPPYKIEIFNALDTNTLVAGQQNIQTSRPISITNLPAANYIVVVSDANGFTVTSSVSITEPLALTLQLLSQTNVSCLENQDGEASVSVQGGEAPYTYLWSNNETTPQATMLPFGTQSVEVTDANQCTVALSVQINQNPQIENELFITNCDNYVWNGVTYSSSGRYSQLFSAANGCDSIVFLNLTISTFTTHDIYRTACNDFTWYGTQYNTSGVYSYTLTDANANGCDSILYLHLTINYPTHSDIYHTACESYTWFGQILAETGTYFYTIPNGNANGCDSILQLHLTINQPSSYHFTVITDRPYVWDATGATYNQSGIYSHFISGGNMYGCDSTVYLHLTIEIDTTGIDDYENNFTLQVMPNPTISDVSVKFTGDYFYLKEVQLFDVYGKLLTRKRIDSDEVKLPMATYSSGLYFLRFTDGKKTYRTVKVIKE